MNPGIVITLSALLSALTSPAYADYLYTFSIDSFQVGDTVYPADTFSVLLPNVITWNDAIPEQPVNYDGLEIHDITPLMGLSGGGLYLFARNADQVGILPAGPKGSIVGFVTPPMLLPLSAIPVFDTAEPFRIDIGTGNCDSPSCGSFDAYQATGTIRISYVAPPVVPSSVPEPGCGLLLALGLIGLVFTGKKH
jgi:hypothetical protein